MTRNEGRLGRRSLTPQRTRFDGTSGTVTLLVAVVDVDRQPIGSSEPFGRRHSDYGFRCDESEANRMPLHPHKGRSSIFSSGNSVTPVLPWRNWGFGRVVISA